MIKRLLTLTFAVFYFTLSSWVAVPVLAYFINKNYIATRLCENRDKPMMKCNGKCYLAKKIAGDKKKKSTPDPLAKLLQLLQQEEYLPISHSVNLALQLPSHKIIHFSYTSPLFAGFVEIATPPPLT